MAAPQRKEFGLLKWSSPCLVGTEKLVNSSESEDEDEKEERRDLSDLLKYLIQKKEWTEGPDVWAQYVSPEPATREEVIKLADKLDTILLENGARETGLCEVRSAIYAELFDELIREEGVVCGARGRMLVEMRNEINRTLEEYRKLYFSSTSYGIRKSVQAEDDTVKLKNEKEELQKRMEKLENQIADCNEMYINTEKRYEELQKLDEEKHKSVVEYLKENNRILKEHLVSHLVPKK